MTLEFAQKILKDYNEWRRHEGEPKPHPHSALTIGVAIDVAIEIINRYKNYKMTKEKLEQAIDLQKRKKTLEAALYKDAVRNHTVFLNNDDSSVVEAVRLMERRVCDMMLEELENITKEFDRL